MSARTYSLMLLSLPMLWADNLGGWAIANALAGPSAGADFLTISAVITSSLFFVKAALYFHAGGDLEAAGIISVSGLSLFWYMLCMFLPVFWMPSLSEIEKIGMASACWALFIIAILLGE